MFSGQCQVARVPNEVDYNIRETLYSQLQSGLDSFFLCSLEHCYWSTRELIFQQ